MSVSPPLLSERARPGVLRLTINNPGRRNPVSTSLFRARDCIIGGAPITVRNSKRMINRLLELDAAIVALDEASRAQLEGLSSEAHGSEDVREGLTAFFERRKPDFQGR